MQSAGGGLGVYGAAGRRGTVLEGLVSMDRKCQACGKGLPADAHRLKRFCDGTCQKRSARGNARPDVVVSIDRGRPSAPPSAMSVASATGTELERLGAQDSMLGRTAMALASRIDSSLETGAATASLARELRATMEAAEGKFGRAEGKVHSLRLRLVERAAGDD